MEKAGQTERLTRLAANDHCICCEKDACRGFVPDVRTSRQSLSMMRKIRHIERLTSTAGVCTSIWSFCERSALTAVLLIIVGWLTRYHNFACLTRLGDRSLSSLGPPPAIPTRSSPPRFQLPRTPAKTCFVTDHDSAILKLWTRATDLGVALIRPKLSCLTMLFTW